MQLLTSSVLLLKPSGTRRRGNRVGGWHYDDVPIAFIPNFMRLGHGIARTERLFELFKIQFDLSKGEVELKQIKN